MAGDLPPHARNLGLAPPTPPPMLPAASGAKPVRFLVRRVLGARPVGSIGAGSAFGPTLGDDRLPTTPAVDPVGTAADTVPTPPPAATRPGLVSPGLNPLRGPPRRPRPWCAPI